METGKGGVRRFRSLAEELESLEQNPVARSLLRDLEGQDPERIDRLMGELREQADVEERES